MNSWKYADKMKHLNPIDDEFFTKMAEDPNFCQEVLRIVMEDPGLIVQELIPQNSVKNLQGRLRDSGFFLVRHQTTSIAILKSRKKMMMTISAVSGTTVPVLP